MTQISSGVGAAKKLVSVTPTGTPNQYDVVYDVYTKNFGTMPITNVMVKDSLGGVNGNANVSNVSTAFVGPVPGGFVLDPSFNGTSNVNIINPGGTLKNYPTDSSYFTIRITARFSNILSGVVYNNSAVATANGFNSRALRDSATNGSNPDLNQNDKPATGAVAPAATASTEAAGTAAPTTAAAPVAAAAPATPATSSAAPAAST